MAKLHIICGNCGCNDLFKYKISLDYDDDKECHFPVVYICCGNCNTSHCLEDNAEEE